MIGCHYRRLGADGDVMEFDSTDFTRSNWAPELQHGSPPLALLTKAVEERLADSPLRIARLSLDILGIIPVTPVSVRAWVERPGKRISLLAAEMRAGDRPVARLSVWALATSDTADVAADRYPPIVEGPAQPQPSYWWNVGGYLKSIDWRPQPDDAAGAAVWWLRPLVHVVDTEDTTSLQNLAMVVDSANGVGAALHPERFTFMNTDTVVHLHRAPRGSDFALRARGSIGPDGIGVTTAEIFDRSGFIGTSAQTLLVQRL
ncbi:thioesterase family protein [Mycobacterium branderi]|uniref:Thioesterase n=1 Tax=Mycobacterium branderi TaxID=43348 RepID=A0A7I7W964_9MYCO|nr:thioesterase family protein [Mycobacterium branderi]MCV7231445.1 thioesterase family protein [Mycobacterium branderi]ORA37468.1 thioesterase [Mycobacterium branderi]BBZ13507.1 thioesterase [Mycobacterium branderi]